MKFVICAGHSNKDPGAVTTSYTEAELSTDLRNIVVKKLRDRGHEVVTDGAGSVNNNLSSAIALQKKHPDYLAVELHFNAAASASARGVESIALKEHKRVCQRISKGIAEVIKSVVRGDAGYKTQEESHRGKLGFVQAGGIIVEVCFMSNPGELENYLSTKWLVAEAIVKGVLDE